MIPIVLPGIIGVALFGFTLSYDEFPRSWLTVGRYNTLPLEIWAMTTNVTSPALYALGTVTTAISFVVIAAALTSIAVIQSHRARRPRCARAGHELDRSLACVSRRSRARRLSPSASAKRRRSTTST